MLPQQFPNQLSLTNLKQYYNNFIENMNKGNYRNMVTNPYFNEKYLNSLYGWLNTGCTITYNESESWADCPFIYITAPSLTGSIYQTFNYNDSDYISEFNSKLIIIVKYRYVGNNIEIDNGYNNLKLTLFKTSYDDKIDYTVGSGLTLLTKYLENNIWTRIYTCNISSSDVSASLIRQFQLTHTLDNSLSINKKISFQYCAAYFGELVTTNIQNKNYLQTFLKIGNNGEMVWNNQAVNLSNLVYTNATQTITNKTISNSNLSGTIEGDSIITSTEIANWNVDKKLVSANALYTYLIANGVAGHSAKNLGVHGVGEVAGLNELQIFTNKTLDVTTNKFSGTGTNTISDLFKPVYLQYSENFDSTNINDLFTNGFAVARHGIFCKANFESSNSFKKSVYGLTRRDEKIDKITLHEEGSTDVSFNAPAGELIMYQVQYPGIYNIHFQVTATIDWGLGTHVDFVGQILVGHDGVDATHFYMPTTINSSYGKYGSTCKLSGDGDTPNTQPINMSTNFSFLYNPNSPSETLNKDGDIINLIAFRLLWKDVMTDKTSVTINITRTPII